MSQTKSLEEQKWLDGKLQYHYLDSEGREAEVIAYHINGQIRFRYPLSCGQMNGLGKAWYDDGALQCEEEYCNGKLNDVKKEWHKNGNPEKEIFYKGGLREGTCRIWYEDGTLRSDSLYVSGNLHGLWSIWYPNGMPLRQCNYQNGRLHGTSKEWDGAGKLRSSGVYVRGLKVPAKIAGLITTGELAAHDILEVKNIEVRRLCLETLGYARFLSQMEHTILDKDGDSELVRIDWHKKEEPMCLVKVRCPSTGAFYALRVPPSTRTIREAIAWTFEMKDGEYRPELET